MAIRLRKIKLLRYIVLLFAAAVMAAGVWQYVFNGDFTLSGRVFTVFIYSAFICAGTGLTAFSGHFFMVKRGMVYIEFILLLIALLTFLTDYFSTYANNFPETLPVIYGITEISIPQGGDIWMFFPMIMLPVIFMYVFLTERFFAYVYENGFVDISLVVRFFRFLTVGKSIKRIIFLYAVFSAAVACVSGAFLCKNLFDETFNRYASLFTAFIIIFPCFCIFLAVFFLLTMRKNSVISDIEKICKEIDMLSEAEVPKETAVSEKSLVYPTAEKLINTGKVMQESIRQGIAGEKLKVELISNVSHDLKTPLTSIVGYGEILEKMELPDAARDYVKKLNHKSKYLMELVEDVFELSKTASGNITLNNMRLDMKKLVEQSIAELYDKAEDLNREIIFEADGEIFPVETDGNRMHRVFQNLLDNALKYSLCGTRIYVMLKQVDDGVSAEIINTSSYKMEFTPETITERFERGDKSRSGEGSGLGLAIAKTYTEACGGKFDIEIKGDQFSAKVLMPLKMTDI